MSTVQGTAGRIERASLILGSLIAGGMTLAQAPVQAGFLLLGLATGTINLHILASTVEHGLQPNSRDRVQVFFLLRFLARYVIVLLIFSLVAHFAAQGLLAAAGGFMLPQLILWVDALKPAEANRK